MALNIVWRLSLAVTALLVVAGQFVPKSGDECLEGDSAVANKDDCTAFWQCAKNGDGKSYWRESKCVNGLAYSPDMGSCHTPAAACPGYVEPKDIPTIRAIIPGCESSFVCPANLVFFIYPNWNNCNEFYQCSRGVITLGRCSSPIFSYFNPTNFACENTMRVNNPCTNRSR